MSKGNMLLGYARGSVGDLVFSRQKGQQVTKSRNRNPYNPRTNNQVIQRAKFSNAVKFFTRGQQNLFKFAFEGKNSTENDFNAFMRYNRKLEAMITKAAFDQPTYPAVGNFIMSYGSMIRPEIYHVQTSGFFGIYGSELTSGLNIGTLGQWSQSLIRRYFVRRGDIVTILYIQAAGSYTHNTPDPEPEPRNPIIWDIKQFIINPEDITPLNEFFDGYLLNVSNGNVEIKSWYQDQLEGFTVYFSRNTSNGLKCSTSRLINNKAASDVIEANNDEAYKQAVLDSWQSPDPSILEGRIASQEKAERTYYYEIFTDEACTTPVKKGDVLTKVYAKVNALIPMDKTNQELSSGLSEFDYVEVKRYQASGTTQIRFILMFYDDKFTSSESASRPQPGQVIQLSAAQSTTITLATEIFGKYGLV